MFQGNNKVTFGPIFLAKTKIGRIGQTKIRSQGEFWWIWGEVGTIFLSETQILAHAACDIHDRLNVHFLSGQFFFVIFGLGHQSKDEDVIFDVFLLFLK